jgi:uncharacterized protein YukE
VQQQFERLGKQLRQEAADRTAALGDLESRLNQAARTQRGELVAQIDALQQDLSQFDERTRKALADLHAALRQQQSAQEAELGRVGEDLRADKVGRGDLAALFTEVALRLRGEFDLPKAG